MTKDDPKNGWWDSEPEYLDFSAASLPEEFKVKNPWDIIAAYPEVAWTAFKKLHDENEKLKVEISRLRSATRMTEVIKHCGENNPR